LSWTELATALRLEVTYRQWCDDGYTRGREDFLESSTARAMLLPEEEVERVMGDESMRIGSYLEAVANSRLIWVGVDHSYHWRYGYRGGSKPGCGREYISIDDPMCSNCGANLSHVVRKKAGDPITLRRRVAMERLRHAESRKRWREKQQSESGFKLSGA
jgi:hypothetical protein